MPGDIEQGARDVADLDELGLLGLRLGLGVRERVGFLRNPLADLEVHLERGLLARLDLQRRVDAVDLLPDIARVRVPLELGAALLDDAALDLAEHTLEAPLGRLGDRLLALALGLELGLLSELLRLANRLGGVRGIDRV